MTWEKYRKWLPLTAYTAYAIVSGSSMLVAGEASSKNMQYGMTNESVNPSARAHFGRGWYVTAEGLVWKAHEDGLCPVIKNEAANDSILSVSAYNDAEFQHLDFKWDGGVRLGIGVDLAHDDWDIYFDWTHFHDHAHKDNDADASANDDQILYPTFSSFGAATASTPFEQAFVRESEAHWKLRLDMIDFELGRNFYTGRWLSIRPFIGLRNAWIRQHMKIEYKGGTLVLDDNTSLCLTDFVHMKNHFWGIGPRAGFNTQWNFAKEWSFYGNAAISLLYGRFNVHQEEAFGPDEVVAFTPSGGSIEFFDNTILDIRDKFRATRFVTDLALGLQYQHKFDTRELMLTVGFGWEHHMFFDQNEWKHYPTFTEENSAGLNAMDVTTLVIPDNGKNLATSGWTLSLRFDF